MSGMDHPLIGIVLNRRYRITCYLGGGSFANVFLAEDQTIPRRLAVKVLRRVAFPEVMYRAILARFDAEARILASLSHPHIVKFLDYGVAFGNFGKYHEIPFLVMEYLSGGSLQNLMNSGPMPAEQAARLIAPIARALAYLHEMGILHCNIKPSNILMSESGDPMLTDFGISRLVAPEGTVGTGYGWSPVSAPSPYLPPEQGRSGKFDARADIYQLGLTLYQCVTGQWPFEGNEPLELVFNAITGTPMAPRRFVPDLPEEFERIVLKAIAREPGGRFQDMRAFAEALEYPPGGMPDPALFR